MDCSPLFKSPWWVLAARNNPWGYGAGTLIALACNCLNIFVTHLFQAGIRQAFDFLRTGAASRPHTLLVMVGGIGHFLLIIGCLAAFFELRPRRSD